MAKKNIKFYILSFERDFPLNICFWTEIISIMIKLNTCKQTPQQKVRKSHSLI